MEHELLQSDNPKRLHSQTPQTYSDITNETGNKR